MNLRVALLFSVTACGGMTAEENAPPAWTTDHTTEQGVLLGVWGSSPDDVWAVGGTTAEPLVMHNDGTGWQRVAVPGQSRLWNVYGFSDSDVYAVGEHGLVLHYDGHTWSTATSGTDKTLFGLWGASGDDVWIAGGSILDGSGGATLLRGTAASFQPVTSLPEELRPNALFKVHGFGPTDVFVAGTSGMLHWDGSTWQQEPVPSSAPLRSTWGRGPADVYAVGGSTIGEIVHYDGSSWNVSELPIGNGLSGVFTAMDGPAIAVGPSGCVIEISGADLVLPTLPDLGPARYLHGVWGDGEGTTYVVGGDLYGLTDPMAGVILRRH